MSGVAQLLVAALVATLLGTCAAQSCQPPYCAERVNYPVYIPFGGTQADLVASLANLTAAYQLLLGVAPQCAIASADMLCSTAFRRCNASNPVVIPVCDIACTNYNQACQKVAAPKEDCVGTQDKLSPGNPLYVSPAVEACTFANLTARPGDITCAYPLVLNPLTEECDHPFAHGSPTQVSALVLSSMSLVCLGLLLATGIATWDQRRAHAYYHIAALLIQLLGVWIGRWLPYEKWACTAPWQGRDQSSTAGALQAGLLMYGTQSAALWNLVLVYTLLNRITENRYQVFGPGKYIPINSEIVYGFVGWFIWPVPFTIAMFAGNWAKAAGWMVLPDAQAGAGWIFIALYIIPVNFLAVIQFTLMGFLFYFIGRHAGMRGIQSQIRLLLLCCHYGFRVLYGIIYSYVQFGNRHKIERRITEWVQCQLNPLGPGCPKPDLGYIGGGAGVMASVLVTSAGIIILLIFLDLSMLKVWWRWMRCRGFTEKNSSISTALAEEHSGSVSR